MEISEQLIKSMGKSWVDVFKPLIESEQWDQIFRALKATVKAGKQVIPKSDELFTSFRLCPRDKVRAIVLLQCPYATQRNSVTIARGIPMDCQNIYPYQQPSLFQWHQAVENQYGFDPMNDLRCDLSYLLEEEGVLLINSALSVEKDKVDSMAQLWFPFTKYLFEEIVSKIMCGLPVALVGVQAQKYEQFINPLCHHVIKVEHPAAASYANRDWKHENMHRRIADIVKASTGETINWLRRKDIEYVKNVPGKSHTEIDAGGCPF